MSEQAQSLAPVLPNIFTLPDSGQSPQLLGGFCSRCNRYYFPRPHYCRGCLKPTRELPLGATGVIYSCTVVRVKAPLGLPTPYAVGYIDLQETPLRVFCLLDPEAVDALEVGLTVRLAVGPLGKDEAGNACLRPYFTPSNK